MPIETPASRERPGFLAQIGRKFSDRPLGVTLFAALLAVIVLALVARMLMGWSHREEYRLTMDSQDFEDLAMFLVVVGPVCTAWLASLCYGLWNLQEWARHSVTATAVLGMMTRFPGAVLARISNTGFKNSSLERATLIRVIVLLIIAIYFQSPAVAAAFRGRGGIQDDEP